MIQIKPLYILIDRFHAALPVSDNRILVSGGCSAIGALQDVHIFNTGEQVFLFCFFSSVLLDLKNMVCLFRFSPVLLFCTMHQY